MKKQNCPNCSLPMFTVWQKLGLGPLGRIRCANCGAAVSVPWLRSLAVNFLGTFGTFLGGLLGLAVVPKPADLLTAIAGFALGFLVSAVLFAWLYNRFVPLVVKQEHQ